MVPPLRRLALQWLAWAAVSHVGTEVLRLGGRFLLARLVGPEDFGRFALAFVVIGVVDAACQLQLHQAIVQRRTLPADVLSTAYWTQVTLGAGGTAVLVALATPLAHLAGEPAIAPLIRGLSPLVLLGGLSAVLRAWLWREGAFRPLAGRELLSQTAGLGAGLAAAVAGGGAWSLVTLEAVRAATELAWLYGAVPWRPARTWRRQRLAELFDFGWPLLGRKAADVLLATADRFLVGRLFGPEALGFYALALRGTEAVAGSFGMVLERAAFPLFVRLQGDPRRTQAGFLEAVRAHALLALPVALGTTLLARELVWLILGPAWTRAVPFVQVLAIRALLGSLVNLPSAVLLARGQPRTLLTLSLARLGLLGLGWGGGLPWGPLGVAAGGAVGAAALVPVALRALDTSLGVPWRSWVGAILPAAAGAAAMGLTLAALGGLADLLPPQGLLRTALLAALAALAYLLPLTPWLRREWRRQVALLGVACPRAGTRGPGSPG